MSSTERPVEARLGDLLRQSGMKLATAESCTGGLMGHRVTNIPGASEYYLGGVVVYTNETKQSLLGVRPETLDEQGAVSQETAIEMAQGARRALLADVGVSITGVAGPGGGLPDKPVGLVWIGLSTPEQDRAVRCLFHGSRVENKESSVQRALELIVETLQGELHGTA